MKAIDLPSADFVRRVARPVAVPSRPQAKRRRRLRPDMAPIIETPGQRITAGRPRTVWARTEKPFRWPRFRPLAEITERIARSTPGTMLDAMALGGTRAAFEALKRAARMGYVEPHHRVRTERGARP